MFGVDKKAPKSSSEQQGGMTENIPIFSFFIQQLGIAKIFKDLSCINLSEAILIISATH